MNNGIKKKLEELIGKEVELKLEDNSSRVIINYPYRRGLYNLIVVRVEEDCVVLKWGSKTEIFQSIDHITQLIITEVE